MCCAQSLSCVRLPATPWTTQPARLLCLWNFPVKNTGVNCHALLQGIFLTQGLNPHFLHLLAGGYFATAPLGKSQEFNLEAINKSLLLKCKLNIILKLIIWQLIILLKNQKAFLFINILSKQPTK